MDYLQLCKLIANDNIEVLDANKKEVSWKNEETDLRFKKNGEEIIKMEDDAIIIESDEEFINKHNLLLKSLS